MSSPIILTAPPSKSLSHRAIIAACLANGTSRLSGLLESDDTKRTMAILQGCGAGISRLENGDYAIEGMDGTIAPQDELDCFVGESGTTCRLLTAVLAAGKGRFHFHGNGRMHERPMEELLDILKDCGPQLEFKQKHGFLPFSMQTDGLHCSTNTADEGLFIPVNESSQYLSGMILAAPLSKSGLALVFDGANAVSKSYVLLTLQTLLLHQVPFSLEVQSPQTKQWMSAQKALASLNTSKSHDSDCSDEAKGGNSSSPLSLCDHATLAAIKQSALWNRHIRLSIPAASYQALSAHIEGDYSGASYLLAAGALGQRPVTVRGLTQHSLQGDSAILTILQRMGAKVVWGSAGQDGQRAHYANPSQVTVSPAPLQGIDIDMGDCPDLVPTVAILAARATSPTTIRNVSHLSLKESNRLLAPAQELAKIGCTATISHDSITIYPLTNILNQTPSLSSHGDHRMAMSLALLELGNDMTIHLDNERCVSKSYPHFWQDWKSLRPQTRLGKRNE